jgi:hypothetical protein
MNKNQNLTVVVSNREYDKDFEAHIKKTIGVKNPEIIQIVNDNERSLTEVYNEGLAKASNNVVVFTHGDLKFNSKNWGKNLLKHFNNTDFGILGVAGTTDLAASGRWWEETHRMVGIVNHKQNGKTWTSAYSNKYNEPIPVVCLDGVFFAIRKDKIECKFNENYNGFHFYDITFTLDNFLHGVKIGVIFDVRITHFSVGEISQEWLDINSQFQKDYKDHLPVRIGPIIHEESDVKTKVNESITVDCVVNSRLNVDPRTILEHLNNSKIINNNINIFLDNSVPEYAYEYGFNSVQKFMGTINNFQEYLNSDYILFAKDSLHFKNNVLDRLIDIADRNQTCGSVAPRIQQPNGAIKTTGTFLVLSKSTYYINLGFKGHNSYYSYTNHVNPNNLANTLDFLLMPTIEFKNIGGINTNYNYTFEGIHLTLLSFLRGRQNIVAGDVVVIDEEEFNFDKQAESDLANHLFPLIQNNSSKLENHIKITE